MKTKFITRSLSLICTGLCLSCIAMGQIKPTVLKPNSPVITANIPVVKTLDKKFFAVKVSRTTMNYNSKTEVKVWMDYTDNVPVLKWDATAPIMKIVMTFKNGTKDTWLADGGMTSGKFIMNSGAYANKGTYMIEFYETAHPDKYIWVTYLEQSAVPSE